MRRSWLFYVVLLLAGSALPTREACAQIYGYTNEQGMLILSNVPSDPRMRLIAEGHPDAAGRVWSYGGQYDTLILKAATQAGLDSALIKAVIAVESGFNRFARSHKGAMGLMQLMPETCRRYGVSNPYNVWQNVRAGTLHLRELFNEFKELGLALAAYNAGATPVREHRRIPPYRETREYVRKVMAIYRAGSKISITKGGRTYSIGPGGKTLVRTLPGASPPASSSRPDERGSGKAVGLAELAAAARKTPRQTRLPSGGDTPGRSRPTASEVETEHTKTPGGMSTARDPVATSPIESAADEASGRNPDLHAGSGEKVDGETRGPVYYRYVDDNGVIYITRRKPPHTNYEILRR